MGASGCASPSRVSAENAGSPLNPESIRWFPDRAWGGRAYVPVDISGEFLDGVAEGLRAEYPRTEIRPVVADMSEALPLPASLPGPILFALLGSTIGNFPDAEAAALLRRVRSRMGEDDRFLLGFDLVKDVEVLEAAYNDAAGVTAAFNLNVLSVLNRELGADFDPDAFRHRAVFDGDERRIEMHLVSTSAQTVTVAGEQFQFEEGESVRTECSHKYTLEEFAGMAERAGFAVDRVWTDRGRLFSVQYCVRR